MSYFAELDEASEREAGLSGRGRRMRGRAAPRSARSMRASRAARRIAELETVLRITLAENRKLSATDDLTRVASRRFFSKHFPREMERAARYGRGAVAGVVRHRLLQEPQRHASAMPAATRSCASSACACSRTCGAASTGWRASAARNSPIVLPETSYEQALEVARKLRAGGRRTDLQLRRKNVSVTASFGLCGLDRVPGRRTATRAARAEDCRRCALSQQTRRTQSRHRHACSAAPP